MSGQTTITVEEIRQALKDVKDPEIPTVSLVDLGVITDIYVSNDNVVHVRMTPTFVGCPAMDYMKNDVIQRLEEMDFDGVDVQVNLDVPWSTNLITEEGRKGLKEFGLGAPPAYDTVLELDVLSDMECPNCGSRHTEMKSPFGPTLCRSIYYCKNCKETFEQFKPI